MAKSKFVEGLDLIQAEVNSVLEPIGFYKNGRTHNRRTNAGLTHVLNFQKEKFVRKRPMFPQVWKISHGKFVINLGIHLPCIYEAEFPNSQTETVMEHQCAIRQRLEHPAYKFDKWFNITDNNSELAKEIVGLVQNHALKFFARFQNYQELLSYYRDNGCLPCQTAWRSHLEAALIANQVGDKHLAKSLFQKAYAAKHQGFRGHVAKLAIQAGYSVR